MPRTRTTSTQFALALLATGSLLACNDPVGSDTPYVVTPITSTTLAGTPGWALTDTMVVEVRDAEGNPVPGTQVHWSLAERREPGGAAGGGGRPIDRHDGPAGPELRGLDARTGEGTQVARAAAGTESIASFSATATALHALQVTVGEDYACAILTDQRPVCWGGNSVRTARRRATGDAVHSDGGRRDFGAALRDRGLAQLPHLRARLGG